MDALAIMPGLFIGSLMAYLIARTKAGYMWIVGFYAASMVPFFLGQIA